MWCQKYLASASLVCLTGAFVLADDAAKSSVVTKKNENAARISSTVELRPASSLSDEEARQVSFAAGRILKHVVQARDALHEKARDNAAKHLDQGLKLVSIIESVLPRYQVKTEIKAENHAYLDEDTVSPRYVTLFDELERHDIISPIAQAKREASQKNQSGTEPKSATPEPAPPIAVSHVDVQHTSAKLDLVLARNLLGVARQAVNDGKLDAADAALLALQSRGVLLEFEEVDLPLEEAADNLKLAEIEMKEGRTAEAKAALHVAIDQLKRYEKLVGDHRSAEVKALHQEITKLTNELEKGMPSESDRKKLAAEISQWWNSATKWFKNKSK